MNATEWSARVEAARRAPLGRRQIEAGKLYQATHALLRAEVYGIPAAASTQSHGQKEGHATVKGAGGGRDQEKAA